MCKYSNARMLECSLRADSKVEYIEHGSYLIVKFSLKRRSFKYLVTGAGEF